MGAEVERLRRWPKNRCTLLADILDAFVAALPDAPGVS
jgi:hypothetical protein